MRALAGAYEQGVRGPLQDYAVLGGPWPPSIDVSTIRCPCVGLPAGSAGCRLAKQGWLHGPNSSQARVPPNAKQGSAVSALALRRQPDHWVDKYCCVAWPLRLPPALQSHHLAWGGRRLCPSQPCPVVCGAHPRSGAAAVARGGACHHLGTARRGDHGQGAWPGQQQRQWRAGLAGLVWLPRLFLYAQMMPHWKIVNSGKPKFHSRTTQWSMTEALAPAC